MAYDSFLLININITPICSGVHKGMKNKNYFLNFKNGVSYYFAYY